MGKYTFINEEDDGTINTLTGSKLTLDDVLEDFKQFLVGCTFSNALVEQIGRDESFGDINNGN